MRSICFYCFQCGRPPNFRIKVSSTGRKTDHCRRERSKQFPSLPFHSFVTNFSTAVQLPRTNGRSTCRQTSKRCVSRVADHKRRRMMSLKKIQFVKRSKAKNRRCETTKNSRRMLEKILNKFGEKSYDIRHVRRIWRQSHRDAIRLCGDVGQSLGQTIFAKHRVDSVPENANLTHSVLYRACPRAREFEKTWSTECFWKLLSSWLKPNWHHK